jgi:hypothetical protein
LGLADAFLEGSERAGSSAIEEPMSSKKKALVGPGTYFVGLGTLEEQLDNADSQFGTYLLLFRMPNLTMALRNCSNKCSALDQSFREV